MAEIVITSRDGAVGVIRMNRADKHNAFNAELTRGVLAAIEEFDADDGIHVVVLTGTDVAFSAGADMAEAVETMDAAGRSEGMGAALARIARFRKPLIACISGIAYGGGALLAITCDIRVASDTAAFRFPGAAYGLVVGGAQLPRIVGPAVAKELLFTARVVRAEEALRIGLVNAIVPSVGVFDEAMAMARMIGANSLPALIATKETVDRATEADEGHRTEATHNAGLRQSPEHHERFKAAAARVAKGGAGSKQ